MCVLCRPQVFWIIKQISIQSMSKTKFIVPTSYIRLRKYNYINKQTLTLFTKLQQRMMVNIIMWYRVFVVGCWIVAIEYEKRNLYNKT